MFKKHSILATLLAGTGIALFSPSPAHAETFSFKNTYVVECHKPDGTLRWREQNDNIVVNVGLNDILDKYFKGSTYTAAHYVGLSAGSPTFAAADTMSSHGGWTEVTAYSESTRQALTLGSVSGQSVNNSASKAVFTINANDTVIGGSFLTTNNTKGGTTGTLFGGAAFGGGNRTAQSGDTVTISVTINVASA